MVELSSVSASRKLLAGPARWSRSRYFIALSLALAVWAIANMLSLAGTHAVDGGLWLRYNALAVVVLAWIVMPRLRDFGWSGWAYGGIVLIGLRVYLLFPIALLLVGLIKGDSEANRYGERLSQHRSEPLIAIVLAVLSLAVVFGCLWYLLTTVTWH